LAQINVQQLYDETHAKLGLEWIAGHSGGDKQLTSETVQKPTLALIGHLNFVHPNRVQVLGCAEMEFLRDMGQDALEQAIVNLYSTELAAVIISNGEAVPQKFIDKAEKTQTALFTSPMQSPPLMAFLQQYLQRALAECTSLHGVFLDVLGIGVLIMGESGIGKSELALELISRGHGLVADDVVEIFQIAPETLQGRCPEMLRDFLEVRGLGFLNIRTIFGETAVRPRKKLSLLVQLEYSTPDKKFEMSRLPIQSSTEKILDVEIPKVRIPVAAGRNLAVLVETAVRNHVLLMRGINSTREFIERQERLMDQE
jgi:HPr kinase/phosphorylase